MVQLLTKSFGPLSVGPSGDWRGCCNVLGSAVTDYKLSIYQLHFCWKKGKYAISQWYYWPTLKGDVKAYERTCPHCQLYNIRQKSSLLSL